MVPGEEMESRGLVELMGCLSTAQRPVEKCCEALV